MNIKSGIFIGALLLSLTAVNAQVQTGQSQPTQSSTNFTTSTPTSDMTQINTSALPDPLRNTLQGDQQFKGWENGQWYFNATTNQYSVQMPGTNSNSNTSGAPAAINGTQTNPLGSSNPTSGGPIQGYPASATGTSQSSLANPPSPTTPASSANPMSTTPTTG